MTNENQKKKWCAEQKQKEEQKRLKERSRQFEEEQSRLKSVEHLKLGRETAASTHLAFMYSAPPGMKTEEQLQEDEKEPTKKAPTTGSYTDGMEIRTRPLGLPATSKPIQCMKCGVWGHRMGDRECEQKDAVSKSGLFLLLFSYHPLIS